MRYLTPEEKSRFAVIKRHWNKGADCGGRQDCPLMAEMAGFWRDVHARYDREDAARMSLFMSFFPMKGDRM